MLFVRIQLLISQISLTVSASIPTARYGYSTSQNVLQRHIDRNLLISQDEQERRFSTLSLCVPSLVQDNVSVHTSRPRRKKRIDNNTQISSTTSSFSSTGRANPANSPTFHTIFTRFHAFLASDRPPQLAATLIERLYDAVAYVIIDLSFLDEHDLVFQVGAFSLELHCSAEYLSVVALKMIVRNLGQLVQKGLTGLVAGEVVDVTTAVRTTFALGVGVRGLGIGGG